MDGHTSTAKLDGSVSDLETNSGPAYLNDSLEFASTEQSNNDRCSIDAYTSLTPATSETHNLVDDNANNVDCSEGHSFAQHSEHSQGETSLQTDVTWHASNLIDNESRDEDCAARNVPLSDDQATLYIEQLANDVLSQMYQELNKSSNTCMSACDSNPISTADSLNTSAMHDATNPSSSTESATESDSSLSSSQSANKGNANRRNKKKNNRKKTNSNSSPSSSPVVACKAKSETAISKTVDSPPKTTPVAEKAKNNNNSPKVETTPAKKPTTSPKSVNKSSPKTVPKCQTSSGKQEPKLSNGVISTLPTEEKPISTNGTVQCDALATTICNQQTSNPAPNDSPSSEPKVEDSPGVLTNSKHCSESSLVSEASTDQSMEDADSKTKPAGGKAFGQNVPGEAVCKICAKHVYHMEQIKAVKAVFHKACFRCNECNKQLNVDSYSSHEGIIYCKPHFKQLFQPKAVFESDESKETPARKYELIICENTPQELPADVIRSCTKQDEPFENINLDLSNIRNRFENCASDKNNSCDTKKSNDKVITRSESIHKIMQKYQNRVSGDKDNSSSSDDEENAKPEAEKEQKLAFSGMSALKSQWESGSIKANAKNENSVEEELASLRHKNSEPLKQAYERAVQEAKSVENLASKNDNFVPDSSAKACSLKEKFEKGSKGETEEDRIARLRKEREEEISRISASDTCTKDARNKFKQIEANMDKEVVNGSNGNVEDVSISANDLQQRFQYFENLKDKQSNAKENPNDDVDSKVDDIPKVDTTKKMLDKFKALEAGQTNGQTNGVPKSPRRLTPPRETTAVYENEPLASRDANIVRSSYKSDEDVQVEPEKAKNLKAKFENWQAEIQNENRKNNSEEEEYVPHIDTTKNLRAMFESIKDEYKPTEKPRARINRFVDSKASAGEVCCVCSARLYPMEKMEFSGLKLHKNCFRCNKCHAPLRLDNFTVRAEKLFCIPHFKQLFMEKGNYDEGFGLEQHKDKWSHKTPTPATPTPNAKPTNGVDKHSEDLNGAANGNGHCDSDLHSNDHHSTEGEDEDYNAHDAHDVHDDPLDDETELEREEEVPHKVALVLDDVLDGPISAEDQLVESH